MLEQPKHLGCVVGLMTWAGRLANLPTGGGCISGEPSEERSDAYVNVLVRSVTAETLYPDRGTPLPLPHTPQGSKTGVGV